MIHWPTRAHHRGDERPDHSRLALDVTLSVVLPAQLVALALIGGHLAGSVLDRGALYGGVAILVAGTALVTLGLLRLR